MAHKAGFVNIIGSPNVGKSTLMNALVGEKLSIITYKAQTTRHRILGIVNDEDFQIVFSDTPGILKPHYKLHQSMMKTVQNALLDADVILYVVEAGEKPDEALEIIGQINKSGIPVLLLINKIEVSGEAVIESTISLWKPLFENVEYLGISALQQINLKDVMNAIVDKLPESPPYYAKDELTDKPVRFFIAEIIREKILLLYSKEIPYIVEVVVESYKEEETIVRIAAVIFVTRESQKAIILGHQGSGIKKLGTEARKEIEAFAGKHVYIDLTIKVSDNWRNDAQKLQRFGYEF